MKKRDRSVTALLVLDVSDLSKKSLPDLGNIVDVVNLLIKRFSYRFQHNIFTAGPAGQDELLKGLEVSPEAMVIRKTSQADTSWLLPCLQQKSVSTLYICGVPFESTVFTVAQEALKLGIAVFVVNDGIRAADPTQSQGARERLVKLGVSFVESPSI